MIRKSKLTVFLIIICITLVGCASYQALSTRETRLLTQTPILTSPSTPTPVGITPTPVCTDEPDKLRPQIRAAAIELSDYLTEHKGYNDLSFRQAKNGLEFHIQGINAINTDIAFIFGGLDGRGTVRSLMLRSADGGKHWKEVMTPIRSNYITQVVFIGDGKGWLVSTWTVEGYLGTRLWLTTDYGETWQESKVFSPDGYLLANPPADSIDGIRIFDPKHIQIKSLSYWANPYAVAPQ